MSTREKEDRPMKKLLLAVPVATFALVGCIDSKVYVDPNSNTSFTNNGAPSNLQLANGNLNGEFGPRDGFDGPATEMTGTSDPDFQSSTTTVTRTEDGRGTGMMILWTNGVLLENIRAGETQTFRYDPNSMDSPQVSANICSGSGDSASIDYDAAAQEVDLTVTRTPEGRVYDVTTRTPRVDSFGNETGELAEANGTFTLLGN
jgi:hypothetical protein